MRGFDDDHNKNAPLVRMAMAMGLIMAGIVVAVCLLNREESGTGHGKPTSMPDHIVASDPEDDALPVPEPEGGSVTLSGDGRTSDELDIWDEDYAEILKVTPTAAPSATGQHDAATDGYHTRIVYEDGTEEWVTISSLIKKNDYDPSGFSYRRPIMSYYEDDIKISRAGAAISGDQNYVDYIKLKGAGIEFVMLRMGLRNGSTGELETDTQFGQNMKDAVDAGLEVGIWFYSEALTKEEAREEAQMVIEHLKDYEIRYPVAFVMGAGSGRADELTKTERTELALTFCEELANAGYLPMLGANKEYLIMKFDLTKLSEISVWLLEGGDLPDYPYSFSMWSYSDQEEIEGIAGDAQLCISFENYGN